MSVVKNVSTNEYTSQRLTGDQLLRLRQQNHTIKVFQRFASELKRTNVSEQTAIAFKLDILNDYTYPTPFPKDMFLRLPNVSPNYSYVILGQIGTGKRLKFFSRKLIILGYWSQGATVRTNIIS